MTAAGKWKAELIDAAEGLMPHTRASADRLLAAIDGYRIAIATEARATAERDVAALRDAIRYGDDAARMAALAETAHRAEPRWPSGPDAERELAAQLRQMGYGYGADNPARAILAALQEKRDPGE